MDRSGLVLGAASGRYHVRLGKCEKHEGHEHYFNHTTVVIVGPIRVHYRKVVDGKLQTFMTREYNRGQCFDVLANVHHTIEAFADDAEYICMHPHRDAVGGFVVDHYGPHCTPLAYLEKPHQEPGPPPDLFAPVHTGA